MRYLDEILLCNNNIYFNNQSDKIVRIGYFTLNLNTLRYEIESFYSVGDLGFSDMLKKYHPKHIFRVVSYTMDREFYYDFYMMRGNEKLIFTFKNLDIIKNNSKTYIYEKEIK